MYDSLNEIILFGTNSCNNAHSLTVKIVEDLGIPTLKLAYPTTRSEIIDLISKTNDFLVNLDSRNDDNLGVDLYPKRERYSSLEVKRLLDKLK